MPCENEYCIYQAENKCRFATITINSLGMCEDCIIVSLDVEFLKTEKDKQLQEIVSR